MNNRRMSYYVFLVMLFTDSVYYIKPIHLTTVLYFDIFRFFLKLLLLLDTNKIKHDNGVAKLPIYSAV